MINPLISIIIPTYNRAHIIHETLDSVLLQTYTNWECFIIDDGSTDNTKQIVDVYCEKDKRVKYFNRPKDRVKGANACRNYGFELSKGNYIQFLDSDDLLSENKLHSQIGLISKYNADVATSKWGRFTNANDFKIKTSSLYKNYNPASSLLIDYGVKQSFLPCHVFLIEREVLLKSGLWNEYLKINQDGELFCRVLYNANTVIFDKESYVKYRFTTNDKTSNLSTRIKAQHLTKSWSLISNYLRKRDKIKFNSYISFGKQYAFNMLKQEYKSEIFKNLYFYRNQLWSLFINKLSNN